MKNYHIVSTLLVALTLGTAATFAESAAPAAASKPAPARVRKSPHETISATIGERGAGNWVLITYGRPYSKDAKTGEVRKIWGGLVPWGKADRLGADESTIFMTSKPLLFGSTTIPAGAYTLYFVPSENGPSKLAFSSNLPKWGIPVDETHDVARVEVTQETLDSTVDQLTLAIDNDVAASRGTLRIRWENTQFSAPFTVAK